MKAWIIFKLATWIWCTTMIITMTWGLDDVELMISPFKNMAVYRSPPNLPPVPFTTTGASRESYSEFIAAVRRRLRSGEERHGIPMLRQRNPDNISEQFFLVELTNWEDLNVTLAIDVTNAYVVAYQTGNRSYFFRDAPNASESVLFTTTQQHSLPYTSRYGDLQTRSSRREDIDLGIRELNNAIRTLYYTDNKEQNRQAGALIVCIQMISEAARFAYMEQLVLTRSIIREREGWVYRNFTPDPAMLRLENSWHALSSAIQNSDAQGVFLNPVQLQRPDNYDFYNVDHVTQRLARNLMLMLYICNEASAPRSSSNMCIISSVLEYDNTNNNVCDHPEPTIHISGRNGQCVSAKNDGYHDRDAVLLWPCKTDDKKQLWTLKRDGTILSNGKCLTVDKYSPGSYVMIFNCKSAETDATKWKIWENGTIFNPVSQLLLSAKSGESGTELKMETNTYDSGQGWLLSNNTNAFVTPIVGLYGLCMQANGDATGLERCEDKKIEQQWALYPDGSVRPQLNHNLCLTSSEEGIIVIRACDGTYKERWHFTNEGLILNLNTGLVMDVRRSDPSLKEIILWTLHAGRNQKWLTVLI